MKDGEVRDLHNPADLPDLTYVDHIEEPRIKATIMVPDDYLGDVLKLCQDRRGIQKNLTYVGGYTDLNLPVTIALAICKLAAAMEDAETGGSIPAGAKEVRLDGAAVLFESAVSYADSLAPGLSDALRPYRYRGSVTA